MRLSSQAEAFDRAGGLSGGSQTLSTGDRCVSFGFVSCRHRDGKPEKFVKGRASRLKAGCSQDWLPHKRAKAELKAAFAIRDEFLGLRCAIPCDTKPEK
jgi:hypothetical protein